MNTKSIFKTAHALTKATIQAGDSYQATFAICLKTAYEMAANAMTTLDYRRLQAVSKTTSNGATALMIKTGSIADEFLSNNKVFATLFGKSKTKIGTGYIVTGRGKPFYPSSDYNNEYIYVYITRV